MSASLVQPGDIQAVDGKDLLDQMVSRGTDIIDERNSHRIRNAWVEAENKKIQEKYFKEAEKAYKQIWDRCGDTSVGHDFRLIEIHGVNVKMCTVCSYYMSAYKHSSDGYSSNSNWEYSNKEAEGARESLILGLRDRMIALDEEAGILAWPTKEDYQPKSKKHWFSSTPTTGTVIK